MSTKYEIRTDPNRIASSDVKFHVGHFDDNGEWWDADANGFETLKEAEAFLKYIESDSVTM